jgi:minichromosome maintenance protein 10
MELDLPSDSDDDDDDEETLKLKLQAIEARLRLKKLQNGKRKEASRSNTATRERNDHSNALGPSAMLQPALQVPVSPIKDRRPPPEPKSPARVLLGIDKGLKARDVSLKRPASNAGGLSRSNSHRGAPVPEAARPKSFSERIAEGRLSAQEQKEKDERIQKSRSRGFGLAGADDVFTSPRTTSQQTETSRSSTRQEMAPPTTKSYLSNFQPRSNTSSDLSSSRTSSAASTQPKTSRPTSSTSKPQERMSRFKPQEKTSSFPRDNSPPVKPDVDSTEASSTFEPFSSLHMTKRLLDHTKLTRTLQGKKIFTIPELLKEVKSPHYDPPDCENDYIVLGIIASKSTPKDHKNNPKSINSSGTDDSSRPKFMAVRLSDLKWEIDLFLFDTGFEKWWKLTEGTVIAILNPGIMAPRKQDSGAFSLKVTSSEDTILEIGTARDLGFCKSIKADGHQCTQWIDKRKTSVCEFHIALQVDKARKGRMELNTMVGLPGKKGSGGGRGGGNQGEGLKREGRYHDKGLHETIYIAPKEFSVNTASMLDEEDQHRLKGMERKEALRKRKRDKEKEEKLALQLGSKGNGAGSEYLKYHRDVERTSTVGPGGTTTERMLPTMSNEHQMANEPVDAEALGLLSNRANLVSLSPVKGRKRGTPSSRNSSNTAAMGWGGANKRGLLDRSPRKSSLKQDDTSGEPSPRKRARLLLDGKGIREPGRESLGGSGPGDIFLEGIDDDDDDLEIVKD